MNNMMINQIIVKYNTAIFDIQFRLELIREIAKNLKWAFEDALDLAEDFYELAKVDFRKNKWL